MRLQVLAIAISLFFSGFSAIKAEKTTAISSGDWDDASTWDNGIPSCGDSIIIPASITVDVPSHVNLDETSSPACSTSIYLEIGGVLDFNTGKKMYLSCGSVVSILASGELQRGGGGGNSNIIEICQQIVWKASDGDIPGPFTISDPLPIELTAFDVHETAGTVLISWETASEKNNNYFTVERSSDASSYEFVTDVDGAGNSIQTLRYRVIDPFPLQGTSYYRLIQTDFDGKQTIFQTKAYHGNAPKGNELMVYPNPNTNGVFFLKVPNPKDEDVVVRFLSIEGKTIYEYTLQLRQTSSDYQLSEFPYAVSGIYILQIQGKNWSWNQKLSIR